MWVGNYHESRIKNCRERRKWQKNCRFRERGGGKEHREWHEKDCFLGHNMMHESRRDFQGNPKSRVEKPIDGHKYCDIMTQFPMWMRQKWKIMTTVSGSESRKAKLQLFRLLKASSCSAQLEQRPWTEGKINASLLRVWVDGTSFIVARFGAACLCCVGAASRKCLWVTTTCSIALRSDGEVLVLPSTIPLRPHRPTINLCSTFFLLSTRRKIRSENLMFVKVLGQLSEMWSKDGVYVTLVERVDHRKASPSHPGCDRKLYKSNEVYLRVGWCGAECQWSQWDFRSNVWPQFVSKHRKSWMEIKREQLKLISGCDGRRGDEMLRSPWQRKFARNNRYGDDDSDANWHRMMICDNRIS